MVAIKGMEMPKSCLECALTYPRWDFNIRCKCSKTILGHHEKYGKYETERHPDCPLMEIIICKDCKHCRFELVVGIPHYWCDKDNRVTSEDFYCADAERRE